MKWVRGEVSWGMGGGFETSARVKGKVYKKLVRPAMM